MNKRHVDRQTPRVRRISALVRVTGPVQRLRRPPWRPRGDQTFPYARSIEVLRTFDLEAMGLLPALSFARGTNGWGMKLLHAPLSLTQDDVARLEAATKST